MHSGRLKVVNKAIKALIITSITKDRASYKKSAKYLAYEAGISKSSILRLLKLRSFSKYKPTIKLGLTLEIRQIRLAFTLKHQY